MSLADLPELVGFFSYSREDDKGAAGRLTKLRERIHEELRSQLGRRASSFRVWQDKAAIAEGTLWNKEIRAAVAQSAFFIPIITPTAIKSDHCKAEFELFLAREKELHRSDLVFPILYIRVAELENESLWQKNPVLKIVGERHYLDWLELRHLDLDSREVGVAIERFCRSIHDALCRSWSPPPRLEADQNDEEEARRRKEEQAAQQLKEEEKRRRKAEEDRLRADAADRQRRADELAGEEAGKAKLKPLADDPGPQEPAGEDPVSLQRKIDDGRKTLGWLCLGVVVMTGLCLFLAKELTLSMLFSRGLPVAWLFFMGGALLDLILILLLISSLFDYGKTKSELRRLQT